MARLIVVTTPDLVPGFQLAGVSTVAAGGSAEVEAFLRPMLAAGQPGVVAVDQALLDGLDEDLRRRLEEAVSPLVVALPAGSVADRVGDRRAKLTDLLRRVVGYHMTFRQESEG